MPAAGALPRAANRAEVEEQNDAGVLAAVAEQLIAQRVRLGYETEHAAILAHVDPERLAEAEGATLALDETELSALADLYGVAVASFFGGRVTPFSYLAGG
jgi:hypothetical protein